tara:strand:- start:241 stop:588 length:348 start_codon:yes stop_codon:yes gene_type:complete
MMSAKIPGVTHHRVAVNGTNLHYVYAGTTGSPILLVHGWPETWWTFHRLTPWHRQCWSSPARSIGQLNLKGLARPDRQSVDRRSAITDKRDLGQGRALSTHCFVGLLGIVAVSYR